METNMVGINHLKCNAILFPGNIRDGLTGLAIMILPFAMFYWMLPFASNWTIGNDYQIYGIENQMELLFSAKTGTFPLYVPGFAGGQSASAFTLGQIFHPITWAAAILPGYWDGKALEWITLLRLFSLAAAQFSLFSFLRKIKLSPFWAFMISAVTVYNLRMLDLFRYSASLESWTGHLMLVSAIGCFCINKSKWHSPLFIVGATYWLITSGHPQMMYYGLMGAGVFAILIPFYINVLRPDQKKQALDITQFWLWTGGCVLAGMLLSSAYFFPFYTDFILTNTGRVGREYAWMDGFRDTFIGTVNNFYQPLKSDIHGVFGGSALFLMSALVPFIRLFRIKIPPVIWGVWGCALVVFLHMQGARTPVHYLFWKYVPLASTFRIAGRISLLLPVFFMLIMAWAVNSETRDINISGRKISLRPQYILPATALLILFGLWLYHLSYPVKASLWSAVNIRQIPNWVEAVVVFGGITSLVSFILCWCPGPWKTAGNFLFVFATFSQLALLLHNGTWIERKKETPTFTQMAQEKKERLAYRPEMPGLGMASKMVLDQVEQSFLEPFLAKLYGRCKIVEDVDKAFEEMSKSRRPDEVVLIQKQGLTQEEGQCNGNPPSEMAGRVELVYSTFNRLIFNVSASQAGWLGMAWPYTEHWHAKVNERDVDVYQANGGAHAVFIPQGQSHVEFRYKSIAATSGMALSCIAFALIGCGAVFRQNRLRQKAIMAGAILILGGAFFLFWRHSLYNGESLGTRYVWQTLPSGPPENIAYGKRTAASSLIIKYFPFLHGAGEAVDGNSAPASFSGFYTKIQDNPWWTVDLAQPKRIGAIKLYERGIGLNQNARPLRIGLSKDKKTWETTTIKSEPGLGNPSPVTVVFDKPEVARYIMISAAGRCRLVFDEIEVYPPVNKN
jgi:hypothetical protein